MKRIVSAFLAGAMALSLAACGGASSTAASSTASSAAAGSAAASAVSDADSDLAYIQSNGKMAVLYLHAVCHHSGVPHYVLHTIYVCR